MSQYLGRKPTDADYGLGEHTIDGDRLGMMDEAELTERLVEAFESPGYCPPRLPTVATDLLTLSRDPEVKFEKLEALLERDPVLAGEVLSLARSAFYRGTAQVVSIRDALMRLGLVKLQGVVMQAAMSLRVFRSASYKGCMERLREHSRATAYLSRLIVQSTSIPGERAFLCGLLHDVGIAGILLVLGDTERGKKPPDLTPLWPAIHAAHGRAGARMVTLWGLPPEIAVGVGAHHQVRIDGHDHPLSAAVSLSEALTAEIDMALVPAASNEAARAALNDSGLLIHVRIDQTDGLTLDRSREALSLTQQALDRVRETAREWLRSEAASTAG